MSDKNETLERKLDFVIDKMDKVLQALVQRQEKEEEYTDVATLSQILHVTKKTIRRYYYEKKIPGFKCGGKLIFKKSDVKKYIHKIQIQ